VGTCTLWDVLCQAATKAEVQVVLRQVLLLHPLSLPTNPTLAGLSLSLSRLSLPLSLPLSLSLPLPLPLPPPPPLPLPLALALPSLSVSRRWPLLCLKILREAVRQVGCGCEAAACLSGSSLSILCHTPCRALCVCVVCVCV
jgi:hypothetical protein